MASTITNLHLSSPRVLAKATKPPQPIFNNRLNNPWKKKRSQLQMGWAMTRSGVRPVRAAPDQISGKVEESIKKAEDACSDDPASGECVAAWDEVEELSAAASHARDRKKESDPLENYCKDNPETDECRTYDN